MKWLLYSKEKISFQLTVLLCN